MNRVAAITVGIGSTSHKLLVSGLLATTLLGASMTGSAEEVCLDCHQFGADSPAHDMPADTSTHADVECDSCHGVSTTHTERQPWPPRISASARVGAPMLATRTANAWNAMTTWPRTGKILLQCEGSEIFFRKVVLIRGEE